MIGFRMVGFISEIPQCLVLFISEIQKSLVFIKVSEVVVFVSEFLGWMVLYKRF